MSLRSSTSAERQSVAGQAARVARQQVRSGSRRSGGPSGSSSIGVDGQSPVEDTSPFAGGNKQGDLDDLLKPQIGTHMTPEDVERSILTPVIAAEEDEFAEPNVVKHNLSFNNHSNVDHDLTPQIDNNMHATTDDQPTPHRTLVDTGWSWLVLAASTIAGFISLGMMFAFGAYFNYFDSYFNNNAKSGGSEGRISILYGLFGLQFIVAPFASTLAEHARIGYRYTVVAGGLLATIGYGTSFFATKLWHLYITLGLLATIGNGLVYAPSVGIIGHYFERYKYFASAFVTIGSALGIFAFPPLFTLCCELYGWHGSLLINSAIAANMCACGLVYANPHRNRTNRTSDTEGSVTPNNNNNTAVIMTNSMTKPATAARTDKFYLFLLRDPLFLIILFYSFFASSYINFIYFIAPYYATSPTFFQHHIDNFTAAATNSTVDTNTTLPTTTPEEHQHQQPQHHQVAATWLISLFGVGNVGSRLINALLNINDDFARKYWRRMYVAEVCAFMLAFAHFYIATLARTYLQLQLFAVLIGASWGFALSSWPGLLIELFGRQILSISWGRMLLFCGLCRLLLIPVSGWLTDVFSTFLAAFWLAGAFQLVAFGLIVYVHSKQRRRKRRSATNAVDADKSLPTNIVLYDQSNVSALAPGAIFPSGNNSVAASPNIELISRKQPKVSIQVKHSTTTTMPSPPTIAAAADVSPPREQRLKKRVLHHDKSLNIETNNNLSPTITESNTPETPVVVVRGGAATIGGADDDDDDDDDDPMPLTGAAFAK